MTKKICVIGSCNLDLTYDTPRIPDEGETILGNSFSTSFGGKGANQAIAIAKLGYPVSFVGAIGNDTFGQNIKDNFIKNNVDITHLRTVTDSTGIAVITTCQHNNRIVVIKGANNYVDINYLQSIEDYLSTFDIFVCQLEIPIESVNYLAQYAKETNKIFILNPAPATQIPLELINNSTYIVPNEIEILEISASNNEEEILKNYPNKMIMTNGSKGVKYYDGTTIRQIPCLPVKAIDTTGAGDTFNGVLTYCLATGLPLDEAIEFSNIASGLSVTKKTAQGGMPSLKEIKNYLENNN